MPLENAPDWWSFELELSPHVEERMIDRGDRVIVVITAYRVTL
jgi:hypothetical protein